MFDESPQHNFDPPPLPHNITYTDFENAPLICLSENLV